MQPMQQIVCIGELEQQQCQQCHYMSTNLVGLYLICHETEHQYCHQQQQCVQFSKIMRKHHAEIKSLHHPIVLSVAHR